MSVLERAPNIVVVCATILIGLAISGIVVLIALGRSTEEFTHIVTVVLNGLAVFSGAGALLYAGASAKTGHVVEQKLNGELDARIIKAVGDAMLQHDVTMMKGTTGDGT